MIMKLYLLLILPIIFISLYGQNIVYGSEPQIDSVNTIFNNSTNTWTVEITGSNFYPNFSESVLISGYGLFPFIGYGNYNVDEDGNLTGSLETDLGHLESGNYTILIRELKNYMFIEYFEFGNFPENSIEWTINPETTIVGEETVFEINGIVNLNQTNMIDLQGYISIQNEKQAKASFELYGVHYGSSVYQNSFDIDSDGNFSIVNLRTIYSSGEFEVTVSIDGLVIYGNYTVLPKEILPFILTTDKLMYYQEETILISGEVSEYDMGSWISFTVTDPNDNIISRFQLQVNTDRIFNTNYNFTTQTLGNYTLTANYGSKQVETTFELITPITIQTDKPSYKFGETMIVSGNVHEETPHIGLHIVKDMITTRAIIASLDPNGDFYEEILIDAEDWFYGEYTIRAITEEHTKDITFELDEMIDLQADKSLYNNENIIITGEIYGENPNATKNIDINIVNYNGMTLIPQERIQTSTNFFTYTIIPDNPAWIEYNGEITIQALYKQHSGSVTVHYADYPIQLSLNYLYDVLLRASQENMKHNMTHNTQEELIVEIDADHTEIDKDHVTMKEQLVEIHSYIGIESILQCSGMKENIIENNMENMITEINDKIRFDNMMLDAAIEDLHEAKQNNNESKIILYEEQINAFMFEINKNQTELNTINLCVKIYG